MSGQRSDTIDFFQNIAIALLSALALFLFSRTEIFSLAWDALADSFQFVSEPSASGAESVSANVLTVPLRFAATGVYGGVYGRYVNVAANTGETRFRAVRQLFADALEPQTPFDEITQSAFLDSIRGTSLYCDFLTPLPLSVLSGLMEAPCDDERLTRSMALTKEANGVNLLLWDGDGRYYTRAAPVSRRELEDTVGRYELGNGVFAADLAETDDAYRKIAPLSLFASETPSMPVYSAVGGISDADKLLTAFRFNPLTKKRYTEANSTEVIMEGTRSVRVRTNGSVYYQSGGRGDLSVDAAGDVPTSWEAVKDCAALLNGILLAQGCAAVRPLEVRREGENAVLRFGYALNGAPVSFSDGGSAAVVTLERKKIASVELRPRRYAATDTQSLLLPLAQALGVAGLYPGAELRLGYQDTGGSRLSAQWFASATAPESPPPITDES